MDKKGKMTRSVRHSKWVMGSAFVGVLLAAVPALAAGAGGVVPRWPVLVLAAGMIVVGIAAGRFFTEWRELGGAWRAVRVAGIPVAASGVFLALFGLTEAPPQAGDQGTMRWMTDWEEARAVSRAQGKPMMVDFRADWCKACDELEEQVFHHPTVRERLATETVLVKIDFDARTPQTMELIKRFEVVGLPRVAFVSPSGEFLRGPSFEGKIGVEAFREKLDAVKKGATSGGGGFGDKLSERGLLGTLITVFFAGVLASLTPCVYPLIPITVGVFGAREADSKGQALALSLTYVVGIGITYSILGLIAASFGTVFGGLMQSPWVLGAIALLFVVLGLTSLGVFELKLPSNIQTRLSQTGGAGYAGALTMGLVAGVIAAPCVGPVVAGILLYVAQQGSLALGGLLLFDFSMGLGLLFVVLGTFSGLINKLPSSGAWLDGVKAIFGVVFFGVALYYAQFAVEPIRGAAEWMWRAVGAGLVG